MVVIGRIWMSIRIQLSKNLQRVDKFLLTAQNRLRRFNNRFSSKYGQNRFSSKHGGISIRVPL